MAYTKNTWKTGDIVSSQKLNHMEDGIANAGGFMVINSTDNTLDKTWQEIHDAMAANTFCVIKKVAQRLDKDYVHNSPVVEAVKNGQESPYTYIVTTTSNKYTTDTPSGYPVFMPTADN